ncbi:MAG: hypothetical protein HY710_14110 [Candidatus Latescibacteria bacterium]|nr:hypothetical protein [Candidatus Latescibacterota bacterium]
MVVLLLGGDWTAVVASVVKMSLEELTLKASIIVVGKVTGKVSESTADGIKTRITVAVEESLKGDIGRTVVITQPGGTVGKIEMVMSEAATFEVGEEAVVFLWTRPTGEHTVLGLFQGKVPVETDAKGRKVVRLPPEKGQGPQTVRLEDFVRQIKETLKTARTGQENTRSSVHPAR